MNDDNILIIADDGANNQTSTPPLPTPEKTATNDDSWLGSRQNAFAENFLEKHKTEFQDFERIEREKIACFERFHALEREIAGRRQWLENLQKDIAGCQDEDIAADLFKNMQTTGRPLLEIAQNPLFVGVALIQKHGKKILQLAEADANELQNKFDAFKSEKREVLKELELI